MNQEPVGVIGLGAIGGGVARSLLNAGLRVYGCDLNPDAVTLFTEAGGQAAASPADVGAASRVVFLFVINAGQARTVLFGDSGLADSMPNDGVVISCVTMAPTEAAAIGEELNAKGIRMIDAPTSGGAANAAIGKTKFMAAGAPDAIDSAAFALEAAADTQ